MALAVLVALSSNAPAQSLTRVTAIGRGAGTDLRAKDEALADAKRNAVEQACGIFINAQSTTENYELVRDRILGQAVGYITEWKQLREWQEGDISLCEISAVVSQADFERDWAAFAHTREEEGNPRCIIVIEETIEQPAGAEETERYKPGEIRRESSSTGGGTKTTTHGITQSYLERFFLDKDVQLMDRDQTDEVRQRDLNLATTNDNINAIAAIGSSFRADVVLYGSATARRTGQVDLNGATIYQWLATLNVRAIQTDSSQILLSRTFQAKESTSGSTGGGEKALAKVIEENAATILKDLGEAWHKGQVDHRIIRVTFQPCTRSQLKAIQNALAQERGVQAGPDGIKLRELVSEVAQVEIDWKYDLGMLADTLDALEVEGMKFDIIEQTANRLGVRVIPAR